MPKEQQYMFLGLYTFPGPLRGVVFFKKVNAVRSCSIIYL